MNTVTAGAQPALFEYGIQTEQSDLRVHVCVNAGFAYAYPTKHGLAAVTERVKLGIPPVRAYQPGVSYATAEGYPIPPESIWGCMSLRCDWALERIGGIDAREDTTTKGRKAVEVVTVLLRNGWFPLWANPGVISAADLQINGVDIVVKQTTRIQVKCDYRGGSPVRVVNGRKIVTGNLFLQVSELNPLRKT